MNTLKSRRKIINRQALQMSLEEVLNGFAAAKDTKFGKLAGPLRAALAGRAVTPSVFDMMLVLGRDETVARLTDAAA